MGDIIHFNKNIDNRFSNFQLSSQDELGLFSSRCPFVRESVRSHIFETNRPIVTKFDLKVLVVGAGGGGGGYWLHKVLGQIGSKLFGPCQQITPIEL